MIKKGEKRTVELEDGMTFTFETRENGVTDVTIENLGSKITLRAETLYNRVRFQDPSLTALLEQMMKRFGVNVGGEVGEIDVELVVELLKETDITAEQAREIDEYIHPFDELEEKE